MYTKFLASMILGSILLMPVLGHMNMRSPPPMRHRENPHTQEVDEIYEFPLKTDGSDYPCKGHIDALGTPEGKPVATWAAGSSQTFTLEGSGTHYGGSCQVSLSYDQGETFKVIKSWPGSCPNRESGSDQTFNFDIPEEAPSGEEIIFAWTWNNREREFFQNCAVVTITGGGSGISNLPDVLVSNTGNGCLSPQTTAELKYPDPGDVVELGDGEYPLVLPSGNC